MKRIRSPTSTGFLNEISPTSTAPPEKRDGREGVPEAAGTWGGGGCLGQWQQVLGEEERKGASQKGWRVEGEG